MPEQHSIVIRLFGVSGCSTCDLQREQLKSAGVHYEYIDANAPENEALCDRFEIDEVPIIQFVRGGKVVLALGDLTEGAWVEDIARRLSQ